MKLITCPHCGADEIGPKTEEYPSGRAYILYRWTGKQYPLQTKCGRCTGVVRMTAVDFNGLPALTPEQLEKYKVQVPS